MPKLKRRNPNVFVSIKNKEFRSLVKELALEAIQEALINGAGVRKMCQRAETV